RLQGELHGAAQGLRGRPAGRRAPRRGGRAGGRLGVAEARARGRRAPAPAAGGAGSQRPDTGADRRRGRTRGTRISTRRMGGGRGGTGARPADGGRKGMTAAELNVTPVRIHPMAFRAALRRHPAGVAVITGKRPGEPRRPVGFTATSFTSASLSPPLVSFYVS